MYLFILTIPINSRSYVFLLTEEEYSLVFCLTGEAARSWGFSPYPQRGPRVPHERLHQAVRAASPTGEGLMNRGLKRNVFHPWRSRKVFPCLKRLTSGMGYSDSWILTSDFFSSGYS